MAEKMVKMTSTLCHQTVEKLTSFILQMQKKIMIILENMLGIKMMNLAHLLAYAPIPTELYSWPIIK